MNKSLYLILIIFLSGCISTFTLKDFKSQSIKVNNEVDSTIYKMIIPYQQEIDRQMNENLCYTKNDLSQQPDFISMDINKAFSRSVESFGKENVII